MAFQHIQLQVLFLWQFLEPRFKVAVDIFSKFLVFVLFVYLEWLDHFEATSQRIAQLVWAL